VLIEGSVFGSSGDGLAWRAYVASAAVLLAAWLLLWRSRVQWTTARRGWTAALGAVLLCCPTTVLLPQWGLTNRSDLIEALVYVIVPLTGASIWLAGTAWAWRSTDGKAGNLAAAPDEPVARLPGMPLRPHRPVGGALPRVRLAIDRGRRGAAQPPAVSGGRLSWPAARSAWPSRGRSSSRRTWSCGIPRPSAARRI
jgi:hypothetical protein